MHPLTDEENDPLQKGSDGRVHVFSNEIFTSPEELAVYTVQHANNQTDRLYFVDFPQADSTILELLVAGYQKLLENNFLGLTNSTQEAQDLLYRHGSGVELYAHSRCAMTIYNTLSSLKRQGVQDRAGNTKINLYAPASNAAATAGLLAYVSGDKQTTVSFYGHKDDFVNMDQWS
ncbi:hypothetical protein [Bartonella machadoae]|uniref:hypothetical protein n=1 Tax=Bartonella machadoae TaxID=2893471 RepID=UPI001F4C9376|nr:hypothetical protein [Bartonella machadoae]UNE54783.1 hypothetical protein LNM86_02580 [Bartonella machadoae]